MPELAEADWRFRELFDRAGVGIAVTSKEGRFLLANPALCQILGYRAEELVGTRLDELTDPSLLPGGRLLPPDLLGGSSDRFTTDLRCRTRSGGTVWVRLIVTALRGDEGGDQRFFATVEDITPQKEIEARLERSEALLRIAGEVGRVGGWAIDADPVRLYWSDEVHDLAGVPRGETPPLDEALTLYPGVEGVRMAAAVQRCIDEAQPFDIEARFVPRTGPERWVRVVGEPQRDAAGKVPRIQGAIMDVTEQRERQEETHQLAERLRSTMESITDALYTLDTDWRFTYVNRRAAEVLERVADELIGRTLWDEFPAVLGSPLERACREAVADGHSIHLADYHYPPLERHFAVNVYPSQHGLAVYFRDVTEQLIAEQRLRELQKAQSLATLAGGVAHDFNNLLVSVQGWAELARDEPDDRELLRTALENITTTAQRAAELARAMLVYSGRGEFDFAPCDLDGLVAQMEDLLRASLDRKVRLRLELDALPQVVADQTQIRQVLMNLVTNAGEAMIDGRGGTIVLRTSATTLAGETRPRGAEELRSGAYAVIEASDDGPGMDAPTLARVFEPFFTTKFAGRGLGLAASQGIARAHGGALVVESEPGQGAIFRMLLPLGPPKAHQ